MATIAILGSSTYWTPGVVADLTDVFAEPVEFHLIDIDPTTLQLCVEWGEAANRQRGRRDRFIAFTDRRAALRGVDAVVITISTGGLAAMQSDLEIPEKYGIYATVGDTTGPSGWSRSIRNIPVFQAFARDFREVCPRAFIANYTNPMSLLTATIQQCCDNPTVGLCHSYHQTKARIQHIFGLPNWDSISMEIAGMNHFHWVTRFNVGAQDGYARLREKIGSGTLRDLMPTKNLDDEGKLSIFFGSELFVTLYEAFGHLAYCGDRHTAEFVSFTLSGHPERYERDNNKGDRYDTIRYCDIFRTEHRHRVNDIASRTDHIRDMISGKTPMPKRSTETAAEMIRAYVQNRPFSDAVNHLNIGQIPDLPRGACVETMGMIDGLGVHPCTAHGIAPHILELMRPQAVCQEWIVKGVLEGNKDLLLQALYRDPQCAALKPHDVRAMAKELLAANRYS